MTTNLKVSLISMSPWISGFVSRPRIFPNPLVMRGSSGIWKGQQPNQILNASREVQRAYTRERWRTIAIGLTSE